MSNFLLPPRTQTEDGRPRRVGIEIEFAGLDVVETSQSLLRRLGGRLDATSRFVRHVRDSEIGDIRVELDAAALKSSDLQEKLQRLDDGTERGQLVRETIERALSSVASTVVPCEIVSAPLQFDQLETFEAALADLRAAGAEGTKAGTLYAFGVHFNPELPSERPERLHAHLQAFVLLYPQLVEEGETDWARRLTPFIDPFGDDYVRHLLTSPPPSRLEALIGDYIDFNPTRNRALDMLPAFRALRPDLVDARIDDPRVQARRTFHYRLANSRIDEPSWTVAEEWNRWVEVEQLAADDDRRRAAIDAWQATGTFAKTAFARTA